MLKGKVQIDLHNHRSGFTERYEKENMITDAPEIILNTWALSSPQTRSSSADCNMQNIFPIATNMLGGVMLFDGVLTENKSNIYFPGAEAHLVGYGMRNTNSDNKIRGSFNSIESGTTSTGYTSVWDFSTSQANGTIRSLARTGNNTSGLFNFKSPGGYTLKGSGDSYFQLLAYDDAEQRIYQAYTYDVNFYIESAYSPTEKYKVTDGVGTFGNYRSVMTPNISDYYLKLYGKKHLLPGYDGYCYIVYCKENPQGDGKLKYIRFKSSDFSFDQEAEVTINCPNCKFSGGRYSSYSNEDFYYANINNGKAYIVSYDKTSIYILDMNNPTVIINYKLPDGYVCISSPYIMPMPKGGIMLDVYSNGYSYPCIVYSDGKMLIDTSISHSGSSGTYNYERMGTLWHRGVRYSGNNCNWSHSENYLANGYLGTICNLGSAVTKTSEMSMKVTYTLTDV